MGKKRVAAYVRVSTASDAQIHSYEFQEQYWRGKFDGDPNNELVHNTILSGSMLTAASAETVSRNVISSRQ